MIKIIENDIYKKLSLNFKTSDSSDDILIDYFLSVVEMKILIKDICNWDKVYLLSEYDSYEVDCSDLSYEEYNINKVKLSCWKNKNSLMSLNEKLLKFYEKELSKLNDNFVVVSSIDMWEYPWVFITFYKMRKWCSTILDLEKLDSYDEAIKILHINS